MVLLFVLLGFAFAPIVMSFVCKALGNVQKVLRLLYDSNIPVT